MSVTTTIIDDTEQELRETQSILGAIVMYKVLPIGANPLDVLDETIDQIASQVDLTPVKIREIIKKSYEAALIA